MRAPSMAVAAALTLTAVTACSSGSDENVIKLGYTASLTGDFASYGLEMREGVNLAVKEINAKGGIDGKRIKIISADDEGKPANGPVVAQDFCDDDSVSAVLGYSLSSVALSAIPVYQQCQLPVVASAVTSPELSGSSKYFFRTAFTDAYQGATMGEFVAAKGIKRVAVLNQQDDYGQGVAKSFTKAFTAAGGKVTSTQSYQLGTNSFASLLNRAKRQQPDAIMVGGFYTEVAKIAKQARAAGIKLPMYSSDGAYSPRLQELGGSAVEGLTLYTAFSSDSGNAEAKRFVAAYKKEYKKLPTNWAALAYDAVYAVEEAAKKGGGTGRDNIALGLPKVQGLSGVTGNISFDSRGDRKGRLSYLTVKDGDFVRVPGDA